VREGQLLVQLKADVLKAQLEISKSRVVSTQHTIDASEVEYQTRKREAELTVARDQELVKQAQISAPFEGLVYRIVKRDGEAVEAQRDVLMYIASIDPLYVIAHVPIKTIGYIKPGDKAGLVLEHLPKARFPCQVEIVDKVADAASGTYRVKLVMRNPEKKLPAGAKGEITFKLPKRQDR